MHVQWGRTMHTTAKQIAVEIWQQTKNCAKSPIPCFKVPEKKQCNSDLSHKRGRFLSLMSKGDVPFQEFRYLESTFFPKFGPINERLAFVLCSPSLQSFPKLWWRRNSQKQWLNYGLQTTGGLQWSPARWSSGWSQIRFTSSLLFPSWCLSSMMPSVHSCTPVSCIVNLCLSSSCHNCGRFGPQFGV